MKITKRTESSISWQDGHGGGTIGVFGGVRDEAAEIARRSGWIEYCAAHAKPGTHTVWQTMDWLRENWDTQPLPPDDERLQNYYVAMVETLCGEKLTHRPGAFSPQMSDEVFMEWHREYEARRAEAMAMPEAVSGLRVQGFLLPVTGRNRPDMEAAARTFDERMRQLHPDAPGTGERELRPCTIAFEVNTPNMMCDGLGAQVIGARLAEYMGVTQADIDARSPRFLAYITNGPAGLPTYKEYKLAHPSSK